MLHLRTRIASILVLASLAPDFRRTGAYEEYLHPSAASSSLTQHVRCILAARNETRKGVNAMLKLRLIASTALLLLTVGAHSQTENTFGTGGYATMHFNAKEMDTKGDNKITKGELRAYAEKMWDSMADGKDFIDVHTATKDFGQGGLSVSATEMDANHDSKITKQEYLAYFAKKFDAMEHPTDKTITVQEAAKAFGRGSPPSDQ